MDEYLDGTLDDRASVISYVRRHRRSLESYVRWTYPRQSFRWHMEELLKDPYMARTVIENWESTNADKWRRVVRYYAGIGTCITMTIGRRRHRKTITTWDLVHAIHERTGRAVYSVGADPVVPHFAAPADSIEKVPNGAIAVWDETGVDASSRTSMTRDQRTLPGQLAIAGHNNLMLFVIVQNTSITDRSFLLFADALLFKPSSLTQAFMERGALGTKLRYWKELQPREATESLLLSSDLPPLRFVRPHVPTWWDRDMSQHHKALATQHEALALAVRMRRAQRNWTGISIQLANRGWRRDPQTWKEWVLEANGGTDPAEERSAEVATA